MLNTNRRHDQDLEQLHHVVERLNITIARLSTNAIFGCLTRQALDIFLEGFELKGTCAVFWDVDGLKQANERWGKSESSSRIREAIKARITDCVAGQVFSGDEFIAFPPIDDAVDMAWRILERFRTLEMSATFILTPPRPGETADELLSRVDEACAERKERGQRNTVHVID